MRTTIQDYEVGPRIQAKYTPNSHQEYVGSFWHDSRWCNPPRDLLPSKRMQQKWWDVTSVLRVWETVSSIFPALSLSCWFSLLPPCLLVLLQPADMLWDALQRGPHGEELREASSHHPWRNWGSVRHSARNWILPTTTWMSQGLDPSPSSPELTVATWDPELEHPVKPCLES